MTFREIINRVSLGVQRDDLEGLYPDFVREAVKEIQRKRDWWTACHALEPLTIPSGQSQVFLFDDFKGFGDSPTAFLIGSDGVNRPCKVEHRASFMRKATRPGFYNLQRPFPLWYDTINQRMVLGLPASAAGDVTVEVSYYRWLPKLEADTDSNWFTENYELMIVAQAKAIAFSSINDPLAVGFEQETTLRYKTAAADDDKNKIAGMLIRIGG